MNFTYKVAILMLAVGATRVQADPITYTYTGNDYTAAGTPYTTAMSFTASFTFASPLAPDTEYDGTVTPTAWSISDGVDTITNTSGDPLTFDAATNSAGGISSWAFETSFTEGLAEVFLASFDDPSNLFGISSAFDFSCGNVTACDAILAIGVHAAGLAGVASDPGTWTSTSTVPEPSSVFLLAPVLFVIAGIARRRNSRAQGH
jgi:hypothetical protein